MSDFETKAMPGQLTVDEAEGIVECFVAGVGNKDSVGDIVLPGAFDGSLKRRKPRVVWGHDWNHPIGRVLQIYEVGPDDPRLPAKMKAARIGGLFAKVQFNLRSERGREAFANVLFFGPEQEWSIGYKTIQAVYDNTRQANLLKEVELYEVSPVLHGANQLTATISIKSDKQDDDRVTSFKKSQWPMFDREFAEMVKTEHPEIWDKGGNIKGDDQYTILTRIAEQDGVAKTEDQIKALELREAWIARHLKDFRLPGVIAQIKWLAVGSRGEGHMKDVVREAIRNQSERKGHGYGYDDDEDRREELAEMWARLRGYAAEREGSSDDDPREELDEMLDEDGPSNPAMGRRAVLARALANELRTPVKIRAMTANTVVFDVMDETDPDDTMTMRASWHAEDGRVMIGKPEPVRVETVYLPMENGEGQAYIDDEQEKADPRAGIPQEAITGDILRGYGPRRGNLERLLRYWRPIMKKPGGFRRCLVILADHPELYPLQNICAWLHHETTGLWPNEGCHHPGMKNCRRKLRGVRNGSIWSDSQFSSRLRRMGDKKGMDWEWDDEKGGDYGDVTDEDVKYANRVLNEFLMEEKEFASYLADEKNWMHVGNDQNDAEIEHDWVKPDGWDGKPGGCGCGGGCGGKGGCGCGGACGGKGNCSPYKSVEDSLDDLAEKVGRTLNARNAERIAQAIRLLTEVLGTEAPSLQRKDDGGMMISAPMDALFDLRETLDPVIEFYGLDAEIDEFGVHLSGEELDVAVKALDRAVDAFGEIQAKALVEELEEKGLGRGLRRLLPGGGGRRGGRGGRMGGGGRGRGGRGGMDRFDPNADDADGDGMVQDGTPFERPSRPKTPKTPGVDTEEFDPKKWESMDADGRKKYARERADAWAKDKNNSRLEDAIVDIDVARSRRTYADLPEAEQAYNAAVLEIGRERLNEQMERFMREAWRRDGRDPDDFPKDMQDPFRTFYTHPFFEQWTQDVVGEMRFYDGDRDTDGDRYDKVNALMENMELDWNLDPDRMEEFGDEAPF